jgi:hypothetical protein
VGYYDRQSPPTMREEAWADAEQAAHDARCAEHEELILATPESAAEVIFDALGLVYDETPFNAGDGEFFRAVSAVYMEARDKWQTATPAQQQLVRSLEKSLANVIEAHIREEDRAAYNRTMRGAA